LSFGEIPHAPPHVRMSLSVRSLDESPAAATMAIRLKRARPTVLEIIVKARRQSHSGTFGAIPGRVNRFPCPCLAGFR
jgi:hypothetical protein